MSFAQDWDLDYPISGSSATTWQTIIDDNAAKLSDKMGGMVALVNGMADGTPAGTLIYQKSDNTAAAAIHDILNLEKARCIGMTIESVKAGVSRVRAVSIGHAPFAHGLLNYGTKLYLPSIIDGEAGVPTTLTTSGIVIARAARGNWVYFYPSVSASLV